ncbi:MAG: hypothetical protein RLY23_1440 [Actinomycetota bacterium]
MLTGIAGFIALGYVVGLIVSAATIADMAASPRSAWRNTGRRRRNSEAVVVVSWFILGWGAVLAGIIWFAGNARTQVRLAYFDRQDSEQQDSEHHDLVAAELEEGAILKDLQTPRRVEFVETPAPKSQDDVVGDLEEVVEIDITEAHISE